MNAQTAGTANPQTTTHSGPPTVAEAEEFMRNAEIRLNDLTVKASRASWVQSNFITDDTEIMSADANEALIGATTELAKQATRYDHLKLSDELSRKMLLLKLSAAVPAPAPNDPKELAETGAHRHVAGSRLRQGHSTVRRAASTRASASTSARSRRSWPPAPIRTN